MQGVLEGFATIGAVIALGLLLAHLRVLGAESQLMLSRLSFFVASPALMVTVLASTDVAHVFSRNLATQAGAVLVTATAYLLLARLLWRRDTPETVLGTLCAVYVNAGNLGLPIAAYVLGDAALIAPVLLMQLLVLQPLALAVLDSSTSTGRMSPVATLIRPFTNPITVGSLVGVLLSLTGAELPTAVGDPLELVAGMAVPAMLLAYGVSLRLGPLPGSGASTTEIATISALKLLVQPLAAFGLGRYLLGLDDPAVLAATVMAALPAAQNIFVHATRYDRAVVLARDSIFVTTLLSVPTLIVIAALLA